MSIQIEAGNLKFRKYDRWYIQFGSIQEEMEIIPEAKPGRPQVDFRRERQ